MTHNKMIKILILSRNEMFDYINTYKYQSNVAYISINDTSGMYSKSPLKEFEHMPNILILNFDDVIEDGQRSPTSGSTFTRSFSIDQAKSIISFIDNNKDKHFIVHCVAGISRSGAVGTFISNYLDNVNYEFFKKYNNKIAPNMLILTTLINNSEVK